MNLSSRISARITRTAGAAGLSLVIMFGVMAANPHSSYAATPITAGGKAIIANTDGDNIRVRSGAGTTFDQVAEAHGGETVSVLDGPKKDSKGTTWYRVSTPGGTGWVMSDFLAGKEGAAAPAATKPQTETKKTPSGPTLTGFARVGNSDGDPVRLRSSANSGGAVLTRFAPNTSVAIKQGPVVDSAGVTWYQVSGNGQTGWMMAQFLIQADAPAPPPAAKVVEPAVQAPAAAPAAPAPAAIPAPAPAPAAKVVEPAVQVPTVPAVPVAIPAPVVPAASAPPMAEPAVQAPAAPASVAAPAAQEPARSGDARGAEQPAAPAAAGSYIVNTAMKYVGSRYVSGGVGPRVFDCSGFIYFVMNNTGHKVSRDMHAQWNSGTHVSRSNLQPGDIVFFSNTYKPGLSHAGIYIGNGKFVHAENQSTGVRVSEMGSSYYSSRYTGAVRLGK